MCVCVKCSVRNCKDYVDEVTQTSAFFPQRRRYFQETEEEEREENFE